LQNMKPGEELEGASSLPLQSRETITPTGTQQHTGKYLEFWQIMERIMKNYKIHLLLILTFAILFSAVSCNQNHDLPAENLMPTVTPASTATPAPTLQPGDFERQLIVDGRERSYLLHVPPGLKGQQPVPVVFAFHGGGNIQGGAFSMRLATGYNEIADLGNFLAVYPNGLGISWNAGDCCGYALTENLDEVAFIRAMLLDLETIASLDPKRIYAAGHANGAALVFRLACEMADIFAAVAPVSGWMPASPCQPE
jgi:poly(3-hydroxybutyrate) depolymerase